MLLREIIEKSYTQRLVDLTRPYEKQFFSFVRYKGKIYKLDQRKAANAVLLLQARYIVLSRNQFSVTPFRPTWKYRPDIASADIYGHPYAWWILMIVNDIYHVLHFDLTHLERNDIIVPEPNLIDVITQELKRRFKSLKDTLTTYESIFDIPYTTQVNMLRAIKLAVTRYKDFNELLED